MRKQKTDYVETARSVFSLIKQRWSDGLIIFAYLIIISSINAGLIKKIRLWPIFSCTATLYFNPLSFFSILFVKIRTKLSKQNLTKPKQPNQAKNYQTYVLFQPNQTKLNWTKPNQTKSSLTKPNQTKSTHSDPNPIKPKWPNRN